MYGEVFSLKVGRKTIIVLNSRRAVHELIDKKGMFCTDRPCDDQLDLAMGKTIALMHNNELWKAERKIVGKLLAPKRLDGELREIMEAEYGAR